MLCTTTKLLPKSPYFVLDDKYVSRCGVLATVSHLWTKQGMTGLALWIVAKIAMKKTYLAPAKAMIRSST